MIGIGMAVSPGGSGLGPREWRASSLVLPRGFTFARSGTAQGFYGATWADGVLSSYATDTPRFERLASGLVGLKIEGARSNTGLRSGELGNGTVFTKSGITTSDNVHVAPSGTAVAERYYPSSSTGAKRVYQSQAVTSGQAYAMACWFKQTSSAVRYVQLAFGTSGFGSNAWGNFDLQNGVVGSVGASAAIFIEAWPNGWYRCEIRATATATTTDTQAQQIGIVTAADSARQASVSGFSGNATDDVGTFGFTFEAAAFASAYIPTSGSTVTRNAETCSRSVTLPSGGFTAVWDVFSPPAATAGAGFYVGELAIDANNRCAVYQDGTTGRFSVFYSTGGVTQASIAYGSASTWGARHRLAVRVKNNDIALDVDGGSLSTDTNTPNGLWSGAATETLGTSRSGGEQLFGHILGCNDDPTMWLPPVSDATLQALSAL